jgi:phosphoribosylformylglycinamidine (FGAM) synthase PurS component
MPGTWLIEVGSKNGVPDPAVAGLEKDCRHAKVKGVKHVEISQLYRLVGKLTPAERRRLMNDLLADPIIQASQDGARRKPGAITVDICFKTGVTDVVGESVMKGIRDLGVQGVKEVRTGSRYRFPGLKRAETGRQVALAFLANPLIQDIFIHVD